MFTRQLQRFSESALKESIINYWEGIQTFHFRSVNYIISDFFVSLADFSFFLLPNPALTDDDNPLRLRENLFVSVNSPEREKTFLPKD